MVISPCPDPSAPGSYYLGGRILDRCGLFLVDIIFMFSATAHVTFQSVYEKSFVVGTNLRRALVGRTKRSESGKKAAHFPLITVLCPPTLYFFTFRTSSKGTDFKNVSRKNLAIAVRKLNHRPRKCLNYRSPHEVLWKDSRGALTT